MAQVLAHEPGDQCPHCGSQMTRPEYSEAYGEAEDTPWTRESVISSGEYESMENESFPISGESPFLLRPEGEAASEAESWETSAEGEMSSELETFESPEDHDGSLIAREAARQDLEEAESSAELANLTADEIATIFGRKSSLVALHWLLASNELQQAALAALLGKGGRHSVGVLGSNLPMPSYLRLVSRLCTEAAEQTEQELSDVKENETDTEALEWGIGSNFPDKGRGSEEEGEIYRPEEMWLQEIKPDATVLDCSGVDILDFEKQNKILKPIIVTKTPGSFGNPPVRNALKAWHLTDYDVNARLPDKIEHKKAVIQIKKFIRDLLLKNPRARLGVTITGYCSKTDTKEYNDYLSCLRSQAMKNQLEGPKPDGSVDLSAFKSRLTINPSGKGFSEAKCRGKDCEIPYYRATLVVVHQPNKIPDPISPDPDPWRLKSDPKPHKSDPGPHKSSPSCHFKIRCCSFRSLDPIALVLREVLDRSSEAQKLMEKYPFVKKLLQGQVGQKLKDWFDKLVDKWVIHLKRFDPKTAKEVDDKLSRYIYAEFIKVEAVFQLADRNKESEPPLTLCYNGWGVRVKKPDIDGIVDSFFPNVPTAMKNAIKNLVKSFFNMELDFNHLEGQCAPSTFETFDVGKLSGESNDFSCEPQNISVFEGRASLGTDFTATVRGQHNIKLVFAEDRFTTAAGAYQLVLHCGKPRDKKCDFGSILLPLGQGSGYETFLASEGVLKASSPGAECRCAQCS